jgi:arsenate reductase
MIAEPAAELVRKDKRFDELKLKAGDYQTKEAVIELLLKHPELMQRPIVIYGGKAVIARPAEKIAAIF